MRTLFYLLIALLAAGGSMNARERIVPAETVEIERSSPAVENVERPRPRSKPAPTVTPSVSVSKSGSFSFSTGGSSFNFDGGWNGKGFHFKMDPDPHTVLRDLWLTPFSILSSGWLLVGWIAASLLVATFFRPHLLLAHETLRRRPGTSILMGVGWHLAFKALVVVCAVLCMVLIGVPLLIALLAFHFVLGVFGTALIFTVVGEWLVRWINRSTVPMHVAVLIGGCFFSLVRLLPFFGSMIWTGVGLLGTGAALATLLGRVGSTTRPDCRLVA
jgi:hypothetical protein